MSNAWTILFLAGLLEIGWAIGLKQTEGFTRPWPTAATIAVALASFYLLSVALRTIPVGTGYAVWTGIGAVGTAVLGMLIYGEPAAWPRFAGIGLVVAGIVVLNLSGGGH
jgi:quaternary ammonium compound-resistance protein SugE